MANTQGVLVVGETTEGQLAQTTQEMLAHGRKVADALEEPLAVALLGEDLGQLPKEAIAFGADKVYGIRDPVLRQFQIDAYLAALAKLCQDYSPRIVLLARTAAGRELGPRLAFRLDTGLAQDCLEVRVDAAGKRLIGNRPVYGGNCMATVACSGEPMMAVIRPKTMEPLARDATRQGEVVTVTPSLDPSIIIKNQVIQRIHEAQEGVQLESATIVVGGGRGMGGPEPFAHELKELADLLKGAVGASRAAVDLEWMPSSAQVGLTGKTITPDLYIMVAISGASQHMAGCSGTKVIVAINRDRAANVFKEARYGVVGDWKNVLPAFTQQVRELL